MSFRWWHILAALVASVAIHGAVDLWMQSTKDRTEIAGVTSTQIDIIGNAFADMRMEGGEVVETVAVPVPPTPIKALKQAVLKPVEQAEVLPSAAVESTMAAAIAETQTANAIIAAAAVDSPEADQMGSEKPAESIDAAAARSIAASRQASQTADQTKPTAPEQRQAEPPAKQLQTERTEQQSETVTPISESQPSDIAEPAQQQRVQPMTQPDAVEAEVAPAKVAPTIVAQSHVAAPVQQAEPIETVALIRPIEPVPVPKQKPVQKKQSVEKKKPAPKKQQSQKGDRGNNAQTAKRGKSSGAQTGGQKSSGKAKEGTGNANVSNYPGKVTRKLRRSHRYPKKARSKQLTGTTVVRFRVSENGAVSAVGISRSSGSDVLDAAALATVKRAAPFPKIPAAAGRKTWSFSVPLSFQP